MKNNKAILFDFDGTLVDSINVYKNIFLKLLKKYNIIIDEKRLISYFGIHPKNIFSKILSEHKNLRNYSLELYNEFEELINKESFYNQISLFPKTINTLSFLKFHDYELGIVSGSPTPVIETFLIKNKIKHFFKAVIGADKFSKDKPDPEGLLLAKKIIGDNKEYFYVGDWYVDALAAKNANMKFIAVLTGIFTKKEAQKYPYYKIIKDISELKHIEEWTNQETFHALQNIYLKTLSSRIV